MTDYYILPGKVKISDNGDSTGKITPKNNIVIPAVPNRTFFTYINEKTGKEELWNIRVQNGRGVDGSFNLIAIRNQGSRTYTLVDKEKNKLTPKETEGLTNTLNSSQFQNNMQRLWRTNSLGYIEFGPNAVQQRTASLSNNDPLVTKLFPPLKPNQSGVNEPPPATSANPNPNTDPNAPPQNQNNENQEDRKTGAQNIRDLVKEGISYIEGYQQVEFGTLVYPSNLNETGQDFIQFNIIEYQPRTLSEKYDYNFETRYDNRRTINPKGTIVLPIQPNASDSNSVSWNPDTISAVELGLTGASASMQSGTSVDQIASGILEEIDRLGKTKLGESAKAALTTFIARKASNPSGDGDKFMSRILGTMINPNMELIFNSPQLRPFNFNFQLTPRSKKESGQVIKIIRAFKEASAVRRGIGDLFLKAPYVFQIFYKTYDVKNSNRVINHPSMNRFKICALQSVSVDYTPSGTYMTYEDGTMTAYMLNLEFTELEPIYADDYLDLSDQYKNDASNLNFGTDVIGY
jgi:hypothetical protein